MTTYKMNIATGPIWNQQDADEKAPIVAAAHQAMWTGRWESVIEGVISMIEIEIDSTFKGLHSFTTMVPAGPIKDDKQAQNYGDSIAASYRGEFTGQWKTVIEGEMSVIEIRVWF